MVNVFLTLVRSFFAIACLQKGPQDLPDSRELLVLSLGLYSIIELIQLLLQENLFNAVTITILDVMLLLILFYGWLAIYGLTNRWKQTITALAGSGSIIGLLAIPVSWLFRIGQQHTVLNSIAGFLMLFLFIWSITIYAHIIRHALSISFRMGVVLSILYTILVYAIISVFISGLTLQ